MTRSMKSNNRYQYKTQPVVNESSFPRDYFRFELLVIEWNQRGQPIDSSELEKRWRRLFLLVVFLLEKKIEYTGVVLE